MDEKRPKSSMVGVSDLALTTYNTVKIRSVGKEITAAKSTMDARFKEQRIQMSEATRAIAQLQTQTIVGLGIINAEMRDLNDRMANIEATLERIEYRNEIAGNLKMTILKILDEIENIESIAENFPLYAAHMAKNLSQITAEIDISIFKDLSGTDLKWVREVMKQTETLRKQLGENVTKSSLSKLEKALKDIESKQKTIDSKVKKRKELQKSMTRQAKSVERAVKSIERVLSGKSLEEYVDEAEERLSRLNSKIEDCENTISTHVERIDSLEVEIIDEQNRQNEMAKMTLYVLFPVAMTLFLISTYRGGNFFFDGDQFVIWACYGGSFWVMSSEKKNGWKNNVKIKKLDERIALKRTEVKSERDHKKSIEREINSVDNGIASISHRLEEITVAEGQISSMNEKISRYEKAVLRLESQISETWKSITGMIPAKVN